MLCGMASAHTTGSRLPDAEPPPTRRRAAVFFVKAWGLRVLRSCRETIRGNRPRRFGRAADRRNTLALAESRAPLYPSDLPAELALQAGKVQNLRLAAACLDGLEIPAGAVWSFWAHVPRPTRRRGFAAGRELREGCVVPSVGGGLCQLSNVLYDAALTAGFEIVERHAHTRRLPGSQAETGRDATVFWNYVDLRFRPTEGCRLEVFLTREELVVRLRKGPDGGLSPSVVSAGREAPLGPALTRAVGASASSGRDGGPSPSVALFGMAGDRPAPAARVGDGLGEISLPAESCETCGITDCFRHPNRHQPIGMGVTAWLVDAWWPEFDHYLQTHRANGDCLLLPLDGTRLRLKSYRWNTANFSRVCQASRETLRRAWTSRRLAAQGATRQRALLGFDAALAARYARLIPPAAMHLVVSQNLLPHLWRAGTLGGRAFDVLMTRLPLSALQRTLDEAAARHPESPTLADFRADPALAAAEDAALAEAGRWITPHSEIARLAGPRTRHLSWYFPAAAQPPQATADQPPAVFFPASTLGRKGAYELRAVARQLGLRVLLAGPVLEAPDFWRGIDAIPAAGPRAWTNARAVVLPSWVEHQPRRLLAAVAAGVPVIASAACGLDGAPGVTTVPTGDVGALVEILQVGTAVPT